MNKKFVNFASLVKVFELTDNTYKPIKLDYMEYKVRINHWLSSFITIKMKPRYWISLPLKDPGILKNNNPDNNLSDLYLNCSLIEIDMHKKMVCVSNIHFPLTMLAEQGQIHGDDLEKIDLCDDLHKIDLSDKDGKN